MSAHEFIANRRSSKKARGLQPENSYKEYKLLFRKKGKRSYRFKARSDKEAVVEAFRHLGIPYLRFHLLFWLTGGQTVFRKGRVPIYPSTNRGRWASRSRYYAWQ